MSDIRAAVEALHASREALPEGFEGTWGLSPGGEYVVPTSQPSRYVVAHANFAAAHIALVASPHVVETLEQLLTVIGRADYDNPASTIEHIEDAAEALADALTRRTT